MSVYRGPSRDDFKMVTSKKAGAGPGFRVHEGALHKALGVPLGKKIPKAKLAKGAKSKNAHVRRMVASAKGLMAMRGAM